MSAAFGKDPQRILALWFPHLSTDRIFRRRLGRSWRSGPEMPDSGKPSPPLVLSHREENTQRISALDERAERLRLKPGMGIAEARAMYPRIEIVEAEPEADRALLESLADWCDRYTPLVALDGSDGLFLDITGCAHLFGGEKALLGDLLGRFFHQGFDARAGLASTPGAAWAAARYNAGRIVPAGAERDLIAPLPLASLRIEAKVRAGLEGVGLRTAGTIMDAPRGPLARRFGARLMLRLDQALGLAEEPISPRFPVASLSVERRLAEPAMQIEEIERLAARLAAALAQDLERRAEGARRLQLTLFRVDGAVSRIGVGASRPLRNPILVMRLFRERLAALEGTLDPGYGFDLLRLSVLVSAPFDAVQADLAGEALTDGEDDIALFADRVRARLGEGAMQKTVAVESHLPERAISLIPFEAAGPTKPETGRDSRALPERPLRLFTEPEPVEVSADLPEGPPIQFRWRRALHKVSRAEGPERIAPEWWREAEDEATRDYYRVEDGDGRRFWIYRQGLYGASPVLPRWYMHGLFA